MWSNTRLTAMMSYVESIITAFNSKDSVELDGLIYDYSNTLGHVDFVQSGHAHEDINNAFCGGVPLIVTTKASAMYPSNTFSFDIVFVDYTNNKIECFRIGDGEDRTFSLSN